VSLCGNSYELDVASFLETGWRRLHADARERDALVPAEARRRLLGASAFPRDRLNFQVSLYRSEDEGAPTVLHRGRGALDRGDLLLLFADRGSGAAAAAIAQVASDPLERVGRGDVLPADRAVEHDLEAAAAGTR
jgi:hypothetical protein